MATWTPIGSLKGPKGDPGAGGSLPSARTVTPGYVPLQAADAGNTIYAWDSSLVIIQVPTDDEVDIPVGASVRVVSKSGTTQIVPNAGVTILNPELGWITRAGGTVVLTKVDANLWAAEALELLGDAGVSIAASVGVPTFDISRSDYFTVNLGQWNSGYQLSLTGQLVNGTGTPLRFRTICMQVTQDVTGGRTMALPDNFVPIGNSDTAIANTPRAVTIIVATSFRTATWYYVMGKANT